MTSDKICDWARLADQVNLLKKAGRTIVFTNGCFDLLHAGHVRYLTAAREQGDALVVGLNSDVSVQRIKGTQRPIVPQAQRAEVLAALSCIDYVTFFDEPDPLRLISRLVPHVLVKGADWAESDIIGADEVKAAGGRVVRVPVVPAISTTEIIQRIVRRFGSDVPLQ